MKPVHLCLAFQRVCRAVLLASFWCALSMGASAQQTVTNTFLGLNKAVPDGQPTGMTDTHLLLFTNENFLSITDVRLTLEIEGGYNGDLYGYLVHDDGFVVLFNREGRTIDNGHGYTQSGFEITFDDNAHDLHLYEEFSFTLNNRGQLTGTWAPDGRYIDPGGVSEATPRTATLSSFGGLNPNGTWTLFLADMDFGEESKLINWSLIITAVPEPSPVHLLVLGGFLCLCVRWKVMKK